jgi:pSer/pThr/pTyr-binding forkhead associated (FHA) protein
MQLHLEIIAGLWGRRSEPLDEGRTLVLGRHEQADLYLPVLSISRRHCLVYRSGPEVWVRDLHSRNGTFLNGARVDAGLGRRAWPDDLIQLGPVLLRLRAGAALEPLWLAANDGAVLDLARRIRLSGDHAALPVLADALEEAGCTDADLLAHCREAPGQRHAGWVVDQVLALDPLGAARTLLTSLEPPA